MLKLKVHKFPQVNLFLKPKPSIEIISEKNSSKPTIVMGIMQDQLAFICLPSTDEILN